MLGGFRRAAVWAGATIALVAATVATLVYLGLAQRGATYGTEAPDAIRFADAPAIGANTFLHREPDPAKVHRELEALRGAGIGLIRQEFQWTEIEPLGKGRFVDGQGADTWSKYDRIVAAAQATGIEILARLDRPPAWATPGFDPAASPAVQTPPANLDDFADFAAALAARYRGRVRYYQIWNEPNLFGEWGRRPPDPGAYLAMLRRASERIRAANPEAVIVLAGLAPTIETGPENLSDLLYLRRLYELGAKGAFDVAASMSYGLFTGPDDLQIHPLRTNFPRAVLWREVMTEFGDTATPIWAAEYGWMSLPDGWTGERGIWGNHTSADQAAWTVDGIRRARAEWPWMPTIIIWASRWPEDPNPRDPTPFFRLMDRDFTPRPALDAVRRAFATAPVAGVGLHQESHPALTFEGPWPAVSDDEASLGQWRQTGVVGATVRVRFQGEDLALLAPRGPGMGRLRVRIDGQDALPDRLPRNGAGEALLDLYAETPARLVRIPIATRLPPGPHLAELTVMAERNPRATGGLVVVDGVVVGNARPLGPYFALAALWGAAALVALWRTGPALRRVTARIGGAWTSHPRRGGRLMDWLDRAAGIGVRRSEALAALLAVLFATLPPGEPASAPTFVRAIVAGGLLILGLARPFAVATVAVAAIPFAGLIARTGVFDRPVGETLILMAVAAWILRAAWLRQAPRPAARWTLPMLYLVAAAALAVWFADFQRPALRDFRTVILEPLALFVVLVTTARDRAQGARALTALVAGAVLASGVALALIPAGAVVTDLAVPRIRGLFGSPNNLALMLERAVPLGLGLLIATRPGSPARRALTVGLGVLAVTLILTFSRGAWIGALLGVSVAALPFWWRASLRMRALSAAVTAALIATPLLTLGFDRLALAFRGGDAGAASRAAVWDAAWRMVQDHPIFGMGPDNFLYHYRAYLTPTAWREPNLSHPHNIGLDAWLSVGLFGLVALVALVVVFWARWVRVVRRAAAGEHAILFGVAGSMVATLIHGSVDHSYFLPELAAAFWVLAAAVEISHRFAPHAAPGAPLPP
ncbi:MAG: O-antigen ligase family protein [Actinobacteria bacterium]|nr:O-antigen ligase family protein [Actinomycetota bacterium]